MANDTDRLDFRAGMKVGMTEFEILRQALRDNTRRRTDMLLESEGVVLSTQTSTELQVTRASAVTVLVGAGIAYLDGDYIRVPSSQTLTRPTGGAPGTYYVKLRHATANNEPGTITVQAASAAVLGNGTRFLSYNPSDRIRIGSGANAGNYRILAIASDTSMLMQETFGASQSAIADWQFIGTYYTGYETDDPLGVYDSYALTFDAVAPVAGTDVSLAEVTLDASLEIAATGAVTDTRSANLLRIKPGVTSMIADTYNIYPNDLFQDHIDSLGSVTPATWIAATNPHAMSASDLPVPGSPTTGFTFSINSRADTFLDELIHAYMVRRFIGATAMWPAPPTVRTAISNVQVLQHDDLVDSYAYFYVDLPRISVIGWDTASLQIEVLATGDGAAGAANAQFWVTAYWLVPGAVWSANVAADYGITVAIPTGNQNVARGVVAAPLSTAQMNAANGRLFVMFRRDDVDAYTGTVYSFGLGLTVAGYEG